MRILKTNHPWKILVLGLSLLLAGSVAWAGSESNDKQFTTDFSLGDCTFSTTGGNAYFTLDPAIGPMNPILLEGEEEKELVQVEILVSNNTQVVDLSALGLGNVATRVIEETEWADGLLVEESDNFFVRCVETNDIFYVGEDVVIHEYDDEGNETGVVTGTEAGSWLAGALSEDGETFNRPGLFMPGTFLLGSRYYQEIAPEIALDRAEHVLVGLTVETPADTYADSVKIEETTPLEKNAKDIKVYAPGVGLIVDDTLERVTEFSEP